ncbi:MAG TPA: carboxypeptidase-like regulatory domain-containing protein [Flavobacterium sp.]|jgi:hypothetical protein
MRKIFISIFFVMQAVFVFGQAPTGITGKVVDSKTQKPMQGVVATIQNTNLTQLSDVSGKFTFDNVEAGSQLLQIRSAGYRDQLLPVDVVSGQVLDIGTVVLEEDITSEQELSLITITENDLGDDNSGSESTAGLLQASRDAFQQAAAFNWGQARFRIRGLDSEYATTMINGVVMNKLYDGRPQWSNWGGLNDATRNQEFTMGTAPSDYTFGGILGTQEINTRASIYRPGTRISFSGTNTNYDWRIMGTHVSGMNKDGWAYVISAGRRWAVEGYFEGTDYSANSLFASVEKKINDNHSINLTSIYAQNSRGKNSPNTQEVTDIAGVKYNSYWGWQDGKKRNSRDKDVEEPITILGHYWKMSEKTNLNTNVAFQTGKIGNSRLDYQNVDNPDPTYYRNLPSYYTSLYDDGIFVGNTPENLANAAQASFLTQRQIDWEAMYEANQNTSNGRSAYILYEDRTDDKQWTANSILNTQLADNILMNGGVTFRRLKSHNFASILDLLGGQFFEDIDNFQTGNASQSDLNNPDRNVGVGDAFAYNYNLMANTLDAFTQFRFTYNKVDFYIAQNFTRTVYQREGLFRNGIYANNSFGKSDKYTFENFGFKGGFTYKITGQHLFSVNAAHMTKAPSLRNTFPNARLNNNVVENLQSENISSVDASYIIRMPKLKARLTGFYTSVEDASRTSFFYGEGVFDDAPGGDDDSNAFIAETVTDISRRNIGVELGLEYQLTSTLKVMASGNYGQYVYSNNPMVSINNDNLAAETGVTNPSVDFGRASMKNYRIGGTPQQAYSLGLEYRDPKFWWVGVNGNYLADNYLEVSPLLRTENFFSNPNDPFGLPFSDIDDATARGLLKQERLDDFYLINVTGGKSWRISGKTFGFFASINNLFNTTYKTGGFEQSRNANYQEILQDVSSGTPPFAPKYFYGYGRTYFVNLYIQF